MVVGGQRHAPAALPQERRGTHYTGGWVSPKSGLDGCGKSPPSPHGESKEFCTLSLNKRQFVQEGNNFKRV
jgi:hypothetical protein